MLRTTGTTAALLAAAFGSGVHGQDVEMLGERYGTPVPQGYLEARQSDPAAFQFQRGWGARGVVGPALVDGTALARVTLGPRNGPVVGTFEIPVLLGLYSNSGSSPPFPDAQIADAYFGAGEGTITDYYSEVSRGLATLDGVVFPWVQTSRPDTAYTVGESGLVSGALGGGGAGNFVYDVVALQTGMNWGPYDNDGPDGIPNSGDDDGIVDVLAIIHPTAGGECGGSGGADRIWSHRWSLNAAVGTPYTTDTPSANGGFIVVDDYTIQASVSCSGGNLNSIGVFTHELGHAFGLPDLYDTFAGDGRGSGGGVWDLMASGSWGCDNFSSDQPCHMGAWSKDMLGWVDVTTLAPDTDHGEIILPPVETSGSVLRVDATDGSGEYFLIENRQPIGFDEKLFAPGLLIWQIDEDWVLSRWPANRVNSAEHLGVWLRQADGEDDLGRGRGRGDAGDPFPGQSGNAAFHVATVPDAVSYQGGFAGLTVYDIMPTTGDDMSLRLSTRLTTLTVRAEGASGTTGLFTVNGMAVDPPETSFSSAPFQSLVVEAVSGEPVAEGERRPFVAWLDDSAAPRSREVVTPVTDTEYVATYGGSQYRALVTTTGGVGGVTPGAFLPTPVSSDLWFDGGSDVSLEAVPETGFTFVGWGGDLAGQGNPASFTMNGPVSAVADFELIYTVPPATEMFPAAVELDVQLVAENGTPPFRWSLIGGSLPTGLRLETSGRLVGAALTTGDFMLTLQAVDALGLPASGVLSLTLSDPPLAIESLTQPFLLTGPPPAGSELAFLNAQGNGTAGYDVGDFRKWVLAHPELPLSADIHQILQARVVVPMSLPVNPGVR